MYFMPQSLFFLLLYKTIKSPIDGEIDRAFIGERVLLSRNKMNL